MDLFSGVRVLEVSETPAAAFVGKLFSRWGAEVTALRDPSTNLADSGSCVSEEALSAFLDGGKRRSELPEDSGDRTTTVARLAAASDMVVTDAAPDVFEAWRPAIEATDSPPRVLTSITPFGLSGPYRDWQATPTTLLALGGYSYLMGEADGPPLTLPGLYPDYQAALIAYSATTASFLEASDEMEVLELSIFEALVSLHQYSTVQWTYSRQVRQRNGNRWSGIHPNCLLPVKDGWLELCIVGNFWEAFTLMIGRPELQQDDRFSTPIARVEHADELDEIVVPILAERTKREWLVAGQETFRVPVGHAATLEEVLDDPQLGVREYWSGVHQPDGRAVRIGRSPFRIDGALPEEQPVVSEGAWALEAPSDAPRVSPPPRGSRQPPLATPPPGGPLNGIRVLDLTRVWAGPLTGRILADLGAEVIKVEAPMGRGPARIPPGSGRRMLASGTNERPWNQQSSFNKLNRNRYGLAIDLKSEQGRDLFLRLAAETDVVLENFSARAMDRLNLGYDRLRQVSPSLIYAAMPGYGRSGPYRDYVAYGPSIEPMTGLTMLMGYGDGVPRVTSKAIPDAIAGTQGAAAVLTALQHRSRTGEGCFVDLSQHEAAVELLGEYFAEFELSGAVPPVVGNGHVRWAPHGVYPCSTDDEWIAVTVRDDPEWRALTDLADRGWDEDSRFATLDARREHLEELDREIAGWTARLDRAELMRQLQSRAIPAGAVLSAPQMLEDGHLHERDFFVTLEQPDVGAIDYPGTPLRSRRHPRAGWRPAPTLGQDNAAVLDLIGVAATELNELMERGVIADRPPA